LAVFERLPRGFGVFDYAAGDAYDRRVGGDGVDDYGAGADFYVVADLDVAEDFCAGADHHTVADGGVAFAGFLAGAAQGDALVEEDVVAEFGGFADDDAHAVVDEEAAADGGAGVDFDASEHAGELADRAGQGSPACAVQSMGEAMQKDCVEARITQHDLEYAARGRVAAEDGFNLFTNPQHLKSIML